MSKRKKSKAKKLNHLQKKLRHEKKMEKLKPKVPNGLAWDMANIMTHTQFDKSLCNLKVFCPVCRRLYCKGFDNVDQYCEGEVKCFYFPCGKELTGRRVCKHCGG